MPSPEGHRLIFLLKDKGHEMFQNYRTFRQQTFSTVLHGTVVTCL